MRLLKKLELPELLIVSGVICTFFGAVGIYVKDSIETSFPQGHLRAAHACAHANRAQARVIRAEDLKVVRAQAVAAVSRATPSRVSTPPSPNAAVASVAAPRGPVQTPVTNKILNCTLAGEALYKPAINTTALEPR